MLIPVITLVLLAGLLIVLLRVDVGILESGAQKSPSGDASPRGMGKTDYEEIAAAIAAARVALNEKKRAGRPDQAISVAPPPKSHHAYDGRSNGLVDVFNEEIGTDKGIAP